MKLNFLTKYFRILLFVVIAIASGIFFLSSCQSNVSALSTKVPTAVYLGERDSQTYQFQSHATKPTTLQIQTNEQEIAFTAEVREVDGAVIAVLDNTHLHIAELTIAPGEKEYEVIVSTNRPNASGRIVLSLNQEVITPPTPDQPVVQRISPSNNSSNLTTSATFVSNATARENTCQIRIANPNGTPIYPQPTQMIDALGILPANGQYPVDVRTQDGWYRIRIGQQQNGWVMGNSVVMSGTCNYLPVYTVSNQNNTNVGSIETQTATYDVDVHYYALEFASNNSFYNAVSYPNGDDTDQIHFDFEGIAQRDYILVLNCRGNIIENLRWGTRENPTRQCGQTLSLISSVEMVQRGIDVWVSIPTGFEQQYVEYTIDMIAVAPADAPQIAMPIDLNRGGQYGNALSYPYGDTQDQIQLGIPNLEIRSPNQYRDFQIFVLCEGNGQEFLRWGTPQNMNLTCGGMMTRSFQYTENIHDIALSLQAATQSYVNYTIYAVPIAPQDAESFLFGVDRDNGGQFNEVLSHPTGDTVDEIEVRIMNLVDSSPNNYREISFQLQCIGHGAEHLRWGMLSELNLQCGSIIKVPFLYQSNQFNIAITLPDNAPQSYVSYKLVAVPNDLTSTGIPT